MWRCIAVKTHIVGRTIKQTLSRTKIFTESRTQLRQCSLLCSRQGSHRTRDWMRARIQNSVGIQPSHRIGNSICVQGFESALVTVLWQNSVDKKRFNLRGEFITQRSLFSPRPWGWNDAVTIWVAFAVGTGKELFRQQGLVVFNGQNFAFLVQMTRCSGLVTASNYPKGKIDSAFLSFR